MNSATIPDIPRLSARRSRRRTALALSVATLAALAMGTATQAGAGSPAGVEERPAGFDHADWTRVLQRFVDDRGRVDYEGLAADRAVLDRYIHAIETVSPVTDPGRFPSPDAELAYYINAYNAEVVRLVLDRGPEKTSVWRGLVSGLNFFVRTHFEIGGVETNLKQLEDDVIRGKYKDPRVHAALNCASIGCPRLPRRAFEPATLDAQLDAAMREFVGEARNVRIDAGKSVVFLSKIFDWFRDDFVAAEVARGNADGGVLDYINRYRDAKIPTNYKVEILPYDKGLNKQ